MPEVFRRYDQRIWIMGVYILRQLFEHRLNTSFIPGDQTFEQMVVFAHVPRVTGDNVTAFQQFICILAEKGLYRG